MHHPGIPMAFSVMLCASIMMGCDDSGVVNTENSGGTATTLSKNSDAPGAIGFDFKFNIIGTKEKNAPLDGDNGKRIFVLLNGGQEVCDETVLDPAAPFYCDPGDLVGGRGNPGKWNDLDKSNKILLTPCDPTDATCDFDIVDANATDGDGAEIVMPDDIAGRYEVYARALGKPGGNAVITLCADEELDETDQTWCSLTGAVLEREKGKPQTENVTEEVLYLDILIDSDVDSLLATCLDLTGFDIPITEGDDGEVQVDDIPIFHQCFENYFWNYDNNGLKLLQVWFKEVENAV